MSKKIIIILYLIGGFVAGLGVGLAATGSGLAIPLEVIGGLGAFVAWAGALVNSAKARRWGWVACLIVFSAISMLAYLFIGPVANQTGKA